MATIHAIRQQLVRDELTEEWQTTQEIATRLGVEWRPGEKGDLQEVRRDLYVLFVRGDAEIEPRHNGHAWRLKRS